MRKLVVSTVLALATAGLATVAAPAHAGVPWLVTVKADATAVTLGQTVSFTGKVTPVGGAAGRSVVLQERSGPGKPWRAQQTKKVGAAGRYHLSDKPTVNTPRQYRVVIASTSQHARGVSPAVRVKVYGWSNLFDHPYVNAIGMFPHTSINLNGVSYPKSIGAITPASATIEFNLNRLCVGLKGTFGIDDDSPSGAQATVSALSDGTQVYGHTFTVGEAEHQRISLAAPLKLTFTAQSIVPDVNGLGAVGTPRVLCTR